MNKFMNQNRELCIEFPLHFFTLASSEFSVSMTGAIESELVQSYLIDVMELFCTFPDQDEPEPDPQYEFTFEVIHQMTPDLRQRLIFAFEKVEKVNRKLITESISNLKLIKDGEYFFVFPQLYSESLEHRAYLTYCLEALNNFSTDEEAANYIKSHFDGFQSLFSLEIQKYSISAFGETPKKVHLGTKPTIGNKGACRFCKLTVEDGATFKKIAHTISEALGNKQIITKDECDVCNKHFGDEVEPHLIKYLDIHRAYFQIKGKSGIPKLKFRNGHVSFVNKDNGTEGFCISSQDVTKTEKGMIVKLEPYEPVNKQKVFKSLCKYVLSVLDVEDLKDFEKTIKWIRGEVQIGESDPCLSIARHFMHEYSQHPYFTVFKRKDDADSSLPHVVAELKIGTMNMIFIVPFSAKDETHFDIKRDFEKLNGIFPRYEMVKSQFEFEDLSCSEDKIYPVVINMLQREDAPTAEAEQL